MANFKAIVVGGGPVGLFTAHLLQRAGIDWVLFEKRESITLHQGGGLVFWSNTVRLFHQLGLLQKIEAISTRLEKTIFTGPDGKVAGEIPFWDAVQEK
jgi:2-polyprenyl-6-methoxyphenol hydroxylase-like FAD-dependent oxidoreductase